MEKLIKSSRIRKFCLFLVSSIILVSCKSNDDIWHDFITENEGLKFTDSHMKYLVSRFDQPLDTVFKANNKEFEFLNVQFFWGPEFSKEEAERIIHEYRDKKKKVLQLKNPERIKYKIDQLNYEFQKLYEEKVSNKKISLAEFKESFESKFPELTEKQVLDAIKTIFEFKDRNLFNAYFQKTIRFMTGRNRSYKKHYGEACTLCKMKKDFDINIIESLILEYDGTISSSSKYSSEFCITARYEEKFKKHVTGDWVYGNVLGAYKFFGDGSYNMSNGLGSSSGEWWINCEGSIVLSNNRGLIITERGIKVGETTYKKL